MKLLVLCHGMAAMQSVAILAGIDDDRFVFRNLRRVLQRREIVEMAEFSQTAGSARDMFLLLY
jgi:glycerol-3-phosphate dehydrogenase